jgi:hypothetical protein
MVSGALLTVCTYIYVYMYREFSFHGTVACQEMKLKELKNGRLAAGMKHVSGKLSGLDIEKPMVPPIDFNTISSIYRGFSRTQAQLTGG